MPGLQDNYVRKPVVKMPMGSKCPGCGKMTAFTARSIPPHITCMACQQSFHRCEKGEYAPGTGPDCDACAARQREAVAAAKECTAQPQMSDYTNTEEFWVATQTWLLKERKLQAELNTSCGACGALNVCVNQGAQCMCCPRIFCPRCDRPGLRCNSCMESDKQIHDTSASGGSSAVMATQVVA